MKDLNYYLSLPYTIEIKKIPDDEGGGYGAFMPDFLNNNITFWGDGDTPAEAIDDLKQSFIATIEPRLKDGDYIPEPTKEPTAQSLSERAKNVTITLKESIIAEIDAAAKRAGLTRSAFLSYWGHYGAVQTK